MRITLRRSDFILDDDGDSMFETYVRELGDYHSEDIAALEAIEIEVDTSENELVFY